MKTEKKLVRGEAVLEWLSGRREAHPFSVQRSALADLDQWSFDEGGNFRHATGRFFTIRGLRASLDYPAARAWTQPIIDQPEQGLVGFLLRRAAEGVELLAHAKMEPGNVGLVQLSPTLQATFSNYTRAHQGRSPAYLEHFQNAQPERVLSSALLSEQGEWFLQKRNHNIVVEVSDDDDVPVGEDYQWVALEVLLGLVRTHHIIHADSRSVLSCIPLNILAQTRAGSDFGRALRCGFTVDSPEQSRGRDAAAAERLPVLRAEHHNRSITVPLHDLEDWVFDGIVIRHRSRPDFEVIGVRVQAGSREVSGWSQPLVSPRSEDILVLLVQRIGGEMQCLVQFQAQAGGASAIEIGPTIHTRVNDPREQLVALGASGYQIRCDVMLSDEGGRFYQSLSRHIIAELDTETTLPESEQHAWITVKQLKRFIDAGDASIELRSLFVCLLAS